MFDPRDEDTIVAPATGNESTAVAIVRLSGPQALEIFSRLFHRAGPRAAAPVPPERQLVLGTLSNLHGEPIDQALGVIMRAPHSFTGEHTAEFQCHGSPAVVRSVLQACLDAGARLAQPGEFTRRAFMNQRLDLAQAEALGDLIAARTELGRKVALRQLRGGLSQRITSLRSQLIDTAAQIEAHLDFPEEEMPELAKDQILVALTQTAERIEVALRQFERARVVREGARVVLAGPPNVGKSSLFNALVGRERAIVSPHPGTTRDTIESTVELGGVAVTLVDTAGIRSSHDEIERMGIERTEQEIRQADVVLQVTDARQLASAGRQAFAELAEEESPHSPTLLVLNKSDLLAPEELQELSSRLSAGYESVLAVSCVSRSGLNELEQRLAHHLTGDASAEEMELCSARHAACLRGAAESLKRASQAFTDGLSGEFVMVDLREAILHLDEILGTRLEEEILDRIFSSFCLGK